MSIVEFHFDYLSPYAYLARSQLRTLNAEIAYRPFDIRSLMEKAGNVPTSVTCKAKNRYIQADLQRWISLYRVPFQRHPEIRELDHKRLLRATLLAQSRGEAERLIPALFAAMWGEPQPLRSAADVADIMNHVGMASPDLAQEIDAPEWQAALEQATGAAVERGLFGAPTMFVGEEMFFGNDRLDFVRARLERAA